MVGVLSGSDIIDPRPESGILASLFSVWVLAVRNLRTTNVTSNRETRPGIASEETQLEATVAPDQDVIVEDEV